MVKQNIKTQFSLSEFFKNGALIQISPDQFKLIMGPFEPFDLHNKFDLKIESLAKPFVYQPLFWDFLQSKHDDMSCFKAQSQCLFSRSELLHLLSQQSSVKPQVAWQNINSEAFKTQFSWSQNQFQQTKLEKTVPIILQKSQTNFKFENLIWALQYLLTESHFGWAYGFWTTSDDSKNLAPQWQGYLGQSPELLADWSNQTKEFKTTALAGTLQATEENIDLITQDPKIKEEHLFVVHDILIKLRKNLSEDLIKKTSTEVLKLKHLLHLKTDFICQNVEFNQAFHLIQSLHPTAALGIFPYSLEMMKIFSELPLQDERSQFAAPFVVMDSESILGVAAIRNFYFSENEIKIFSGCGVTSQSDYESELIELELKRNSVKKMMGISE